jgi:hypothetical protein
MGIEEEKTENVSKISDAADINDPFGSAISVAPEAVVAADADIIKALSFRSLKKVLFIALPSGAVFAAAGALLISFMPLEIFFAGVMLFIGLFFLLFPLGFAAAIPILAKKSQAVRYGLTIRYVFGERISVSEKSAVSEAKDVFYDWIIVVKADEDKERFFLFISNNRAFVIPKEKLQNISPDGFRGLLRQKLGARYKGK